MKAVATKADQRLRPGDGAGRFRRVESASRRAEPILNVSTSDSKEAPRSHGAGERIQASKFSARMSRNVLPAIRPSPTFGQTCPRRCAGRARGSVNQNVEPLPTTLSTPIVPP